MITETLALLGRRAEDKVTGFEGVISSVCFDLYGCVQAALTPSKKRDGNLGDGHWFDVQRLKVMPGKPVMTAPDFDAVAKTPAEHKSGPAEKPAFGARGRRA